MYIGSLTIKIEINNIDFGLYEIPVAKSIAAVNKNF